MNLSLYINYIKKCANRLSALNRREGWGLVKSITTYFDFFWAAIRHGCLIDQYVDGGFYKKKNFERSNIITYRRLCKIIDICNSPKHTYKLENKVEFNRHFGKWVKRFSASSAELTFQQLKDVCLRVDELFIKPLDEYEGKGISKITVPKSDSEIQLLLEKLKSQKLIVEECLQQMPEMVFNNKSINTIRINTLLGSDGEVHCFKPVLRAGVGDSVVDNYNAGGCEYAIDMDTGVIMLPGFQESKLQHIYHPQSDIKMVGFTIPKWDEIISVVKAAANHIPECRFIGWDVALTTHGIELIEGNHNPGYVCMEYFGTTGWYTRLMEWI